MHPYNAFPTAHGKPLMLTAEQHRIVSSEHPSAIIAALAGTGKTTTLACRAVQLLRNQPEARILVLAYSKAGVAAFKHRLEMLLGTVPAGMQITTLERWCARHLRTQDAQVRFTVDPVELRQSAQQALLALEEQLQRHSDDRLILPQEVDMPSFWAFQRAAKKTMWLSHVQEQGLDLAEFCDAHLLDYTHARLLACYERLRMDHCGDIRYYAEGDCTYALAQNDSPLETAYDLILFDELHDLDLASLHVLRRMLQGSASHFLGAGDFNQHIEAQAWSVFQDQLHQLTDFLPQATHTLPLTQSRRFGSDIAQAVNRWFNVSMQAVATRKSAVMHWRYESKAHCLAMLTQAQTVAAKAHAVPLTVIVRHAQDAVDLEWMAYRAGQSVALHGLQPFYLHREIALLLGLMYAHGMQSAHWKDKTCILGAPILQAFIDGALYFGKGRLVHTAASASSDLPSDLPSMAAQMHANPQAIWRFLMGTDNLQGGKRNFSAFGNFLHLPQTLQSNAIALLEQADAWALFDSTQLSNEAREQLRASVRAFMKSIQGMSVPEVLKHVATMSSRADKLARQGIHSDYQILSIEQAKGQEFDCVAIPFLAPGHFPAPAAKNSAFLERNRLYVAMTRARHKLWLLEDVLHPVPAFDEMPKHRQQLGAHTA